ncbi:MAG TPA: hypothetical protein DCM08_10555 [Microscillaceae bacterium]|jgi:uncharacterized membrane protein|nr:hypothetical protein [Microscillaceae bacterium]
MAEKYLTPQEEAFLIDTIRKAERLTSGEIKVHLEARVGQKDTFARALDVFSKLGLHKTQLRNGVLFYVAVWERKFAIVADEGINQKVPDDFWDSITEEMKVFFQKEQLLEGLRLGIKHAGEALQKYFPIAEDDVNELSNDISQE